MTATTQTMAPAENKMGTMPVPKLLVTMSLPMMISMLVQALYNIVDSMFVAKLSEEALTAVSLAFPAQTLMISIASGTGVGVNALLSRNLGEKNFESADLAARNGVFLGILSCIVFAMAGGFGAHFFFAIQTDDPVIVNYGTQYLRVISVLSIGIFMQITFERLLQSTGKTVYNMITQGTGAIINMILDPIFIFGLFGMPKLEVIGAAIATVAGQMVAVCMSFYFNLTKNKEINISLKGFRPNGRIIATIYRVGIPSIIMQSIGSVMTFGFNKILLAFSSTAAAVFGVYFKLQSFVFMPVFGMNNGMIPIIAYNYGARKKDRIIHTIKLSIAISVCIMIIGMALFEIFPAFLLSTLFSASAQMLEIGVPALRIIAVHFILAGYSIILSSTFQALGNGVYSLIVSASRQLIILLPVAFLFSRLFGLSAVWWSFPIAELAAVLICTVLFTRIYKKKIRPL